jgi:ubiquinone/menaquinone biosynthesis C-methylase UbiE
VDLAVWAIALSHVPELRRVFERLVRVLRPGGHLVVLDTRGLPGERLHALAVEATNAAWRDKPAAIIWHFQPAALP